MGSKSFEGATASTSNIETPKADFRPDLIMGQPTATASLGPGSGGKTIITCTILWKSVQSVLMWLMLLGNLRLIDISKGLTKA